MEVILINEDKVHYHKDIIKKSDFIVENVKLGDRNLNPGLASATN